ncbi:MAG TPA: YkgJ family cysteine cluster protein [Victivallales bacterium]|nr:YkgJ family cysteine cluster protein [Victivallales bacterium]
MSRKKSIGLISLPEVRYDCICCAECCGPWEIPVSAEEKSDLQGACSGKEIFQKGISSPIVLRKKFDGNCVFLDESNLCVIHKTKGEGSKPLGCRLYPFEFCKWDDGITSFYCRMDCWGTGFPVLDRKDQKKIKLESSAFEKEIRNSSPVSANKYSDKLILDTRRMRFIADGYRRIIEHGKGSISAKILACAEMLQFYSRKENCGDLLKADVSFVEKSVSIYERNISRLEETVKISPNPDLPTNFFFRQLLTGFVRRDEDYLISPSVFKRIVRAFHVAAFCLGATRLDSLGNRLLKFENDVAKPDSCNGISDLLRSYFSGRISSMHFMSRPCLNFSFEEGMRHLICSALSVGAISKEFPKSDPMLPIRVVDHNFSSSAFFTMFQSDVCRRKITDPVPLSCLLKELFGNS